MSLMLALTSSSLRAQNCSSADIVLTTQAEVDGVQATYGPCDTVTGDLVVVNGTDIVDLDGLAGITVVGGLLYLRNNDVLANIDGLSDIANVNVWVKIEGNLVLANLDGLSGLTANTSVIEIIDNANLANVDGLSALTSAKDLYIKDNPALTDLDGLSALAQVSSGITINGNDSLTWRLLTILCWQASTDCPV
jgi:hypothetical protein